MTKNKDCVLRLRDAGFSLEDANSLRRIAMTLHRWHEMECGDGNGYIERDEKTGKPRYFNARANYLAANDPRAWFAIPDREKGALKRLAAIPDREKGALKRLAAIMKRYPDFVEYVQTDPRGASLYICKRSETPQPIEQHYSRGIAVYK